MQHWSIYWYSVKSCSGVDFLIGTSSWKAFPKNIIVANIYSIFNKIRTRFSYEMFTPHQIINMLSLKSEVSLFVWFKSRRANEFSFSINFEGYLHSVIPTFKAFQWTPLSSNELWIGQRVYFNTLSSCPIRASLCESWRQFDSSRNMPTLKCWLPPQQCIN